MQYYQVEKEKEPEKLTRGELTESNEGKKVKQKTLLVQRDAKVFDRP